MTDFKRRFLKTPTILVYITMISLGMRLYQLDAESLSMDEIVTVETYHGSPTDIVMSAAIEGQPPLDNFLGAFLYRLGLGQSDWWVRFPATLFGAGSVLLLGFWVRRAAGDVAGVTAAILLAVCPLHVYMSQEARPYALMFFLALASGLLYVRARERNDIKSWVIYALVLFAMLMTRWTDPHFIVLGIGVHAVLSRSRIPKQSPELAAVESSIFRRFSWFTIAAYAVYCPFFINIIRFQGTAIRPPSMDWSIRFFSLLNESFTALFAGYSARTLFTALPGMRWLVLTAASLMIAGLMLAFLGRKERDSAFWWIFLPYPFIYALVYGLLGNAVPKPQYLLLMAVFVISCISQALESVRAGTKHSMLRLGAFAGLLLLFVVPMAQGSWTSLGGMDKTDWRGAMGYLKQHAHAGDVAVCLGSDTVVPAFRPKAYGKNRYGPEALKFVPISTDTPLSALAGEGWSCADNTVWILTYRDRMYTGVDQLSPPRRADVVRSVQFFQGLLLMELAPGRPAVQRLMDTIGQWYTELPVRKSFSAPALLRWRYFASRGDKTEADRSLGAARRQCARFEELATLNRLIQAEESRTGRRKFSISAPGLRCAGEGSRFP